MNKKFVRHRVRRRRGYKGNSKMKILVFLGIMMMAVILGYFTARFVIGPILGYNADESPVSDQSDGKTDQEQNVSAPVSSDKGYALQFGAFSSREAAQKLSDMLAEKGIKTQIVETDQVFKVMSQADENKENVLEQLEEAKEKDIEDVFVASLG